MKAKNSFLFFLILPIACLHVLKALGAGPDYRNDPVQAPLAIPISQDYLPTSPHSFPIVTLQMSCKSNTKWPNPECAYDPDFDLALEQEYWRHVALQDTDGMSRWISKKDLYVKNSQSPNASRFDMLSIFGHLQVYSKEAKIFDVGQSPRVFKAFQSAHTAMKALPRSPNTAAFYWAMRNFTDFALGLNASGLKAAQKMIDLATQYKEQGLAGPVGAVAHLMGSKDKTIVKLGVETYDDCFENGICKLETTIAPFQIIGSRIAQAEAYAFLGEYDKMEATFEDVEKLSAQRKWPLAHRIPEIRNHLTKKGGLIDQWKFQIHPGGLRFPLGAAHQIEACAMCHIGNTVPTHYAIQ